MAPFQVFWKTEDYGFLGREWRHNFWQCEEMKTEDFFRFSTCEDWRMNNSKKCEDLMWRMYSQVQRSQSQLNSNSTNIIFCMESGNASGKCPYLNLCRRIPSGILRQHVHLLLPSDLPIFCQLCSLTHNSIPKPHSWLRASFARSSWVFLFSSFHQELNPN